MSTDTGESSKSGVVYLVLVGVMTLFCAVLMALVVLALVRNDQLSTEVYQMSKKYDDLVNQINEGQVDESSVTTAGDQTTSATDGNTLAATTSAQEYVATTTQVPEEPDCNTAKFEFSEARHLDYVQYSGTLPEMAEFTMCFWITPYQGNDLLGTLVSYCVTGDAYCNTVYVEFTSSDIYVSVDGSTYYFSRSTGITDRSLMCFVLASETNKIHYHLNETEPHEAIEISSNVFPQGGVLILGQDHDGAISGNAPGTPKNEAEAFQGIVDGFAIWDKSLTAEEVIDIYESGCTCAEDAIVVFNSTNSVVTGNVTASWNVACP